MCSWHNGRHGVQSATEDARAAAWLPVNAAVPRTGIAVCKLLCCVMELSGHASKAVCCDSCRRVIFHKEGWCQMQAAGLMVCCRVHPIDLTAS
jgi:hypothetical protein